MFLVFSFLFFPPKKLEISCECGRLWVLVSVWVLVGVWVWVCVCVGVIIIKNHNYNYNCKHNYKSFLSWSSKFFFFKIGVLWPEVTQNCKNWKLKIENFSCGTARVLGRLLGGWVWRWVAWGGGVWGVKCLEKCWGVIESMFSGLGSNNDEGDSEVWSALWVVWFSEPLASWTRHFSFILFLFILCISSFSSILFFVFFLFCFVFVSSWFACDFYFRHFLFSFFFFVIFSWFECSWFFFRVFFFLSFSFFGILFFMIFLCNLFSGCLFVFSFVFFFVFWSCNFNQHCSCNSSCVFTGKTQLQLQSKMQLRSNQVINFQIWCSCDTKFENWKLEISKLYQTTSDHK